MNILFFLILIFAILLEGIITSIPLVLDVLLVAYILKRKSSLFILALILGIVLDVFSVRTLGSSSIYFVSFLFIVFLYERKFEITTYPFILFSSFLGALFYLWIFGYDYVLLQSLASSLISVLLFKILSVKLKVQSEKLQLKA